MESTTPSHFKRWLSNYVNGRQTYVEFKGSKSKHRRVKEGVFHEEWSSVTVQRIPNRPPNATSRYQHNIVCGWYFHFDSWEQYTTALSKHRTVPIDSTSVAKKSSPGIVTWQIVVHTFHTELGISIDNVIPTMNSISMQRIPEIKCRLRTIPWKRLQEVPGGKITKFSQSHTKRYKAIIRPIANNAAPVYAPQLAESNWKSIQRVQNASLRLITGCHAIIHEDDDLHIETNILLIKQHTEKLAQQYVFESKQPTHPNNHLTTTQDPSRKIRTSPVRKYRDTINILSPPMSQSALKRRLDAIHTNT